MEIKNAEDRRQMFIRINKVVFSARHDHSLVRQASPTRIVVRLDDTTYTFDFGTDSLVRLWMISTFGNDTYVRGYGVGVSGMVILPAQAVVLEGVRDAVLAARKR
jgi:hypothetical protein